VDDAIIVVGWIDHMAVDEGKTYSTVDAYITGAKTQQMKTELIISWNWGERVTRGMCGSRAPCSLWPGR
jgi:hypothetical protein